MWISKAEVGVDIIGARITVPPTPEQAHGGARFDLILSPRCHLSHLRLLGGLILLGAE